MEATDDVFTITPRSPLAKAGCVLMRVAASRITLKLPTRLMRTARSKLARTWGPFLPTTRSPGAMPAQLTTPCTPPKALAHRSTAASVCASSVTSVRRKRARAPSSWATAAPASFTSAISTLPPACASMRAVAAPSPEPPPATRNAWSWICMELLGRSGKEDGSDRQVVLPCPMLPMGRCLDGESAAQRVDGELGHREGLGQAPGEVRLEGRDRDP